MKKIFIIGIVVIVGGILLLWVWTRFNSGSTPQNQPRTQFPGSTSISATTSSMSMLIGSTTITVKNFLADPGTKEYYTDYYYLGNQPTAPAPYVIEYIASTHFFNISLLQEPIGQARAQAEAYLLEHLGISKDQLCMLNYMLSTPDSVNSTYSDENLGFSFCPGAVPLPN